ncbi:hypothetical protein, variant [Plasmodium yoelii 17X]|uniref:Uncharacterized protein n=1 Tax=Plasmodium yoelii 17X TaxID=1323249 RepID=V7PE20_PLAYE|nr:hypothetical protein, variant [Plasmodium yoelii 17X]
MHTYTNPENYIVFFKLTTWLYMHFETNVFFNYLFITFRKIFKNKLSKTNDLIIECEETSSQMSNYKICFDKLTKILEEAENYKEKVKYTNVKEFIHLIKTDDQIKKYKDKLINQKKKKREKKFNKRDYD